MPPRDSDLLLELPPDQAAQILALGTPMSLQKGETLFLLGAEATNLYLVLAGRVRLTLPMHLEEREEDVLVEERVPGQLLGWSALIPPYRFTLKGTATVETELLALPGRELLSHLSDRPEVGCAVMSNLARIIGQRLQLFQTMWVREMQRLVQMSIPELPGDPSETLP